MPPSPNAVLRGGPAVISEEERLRHLDDTAGSFKLLRGNRYEHFAPTGETVTHEDGELHVFTWSGCTYVAE